MAGGLIWSLRSLAELGDIADYIAKNSPFYANMVVHRMVERAELLSEMPRQRRRLPEYYGPVELREVFVHGWRIIYAVVDEAVQVVPIIHAARSLENAAPL